MILFKTGKNRYAGSEIFHRKTAFFLDLPRRPNEISRFRSFLKNGTLITVVFRITGVQCRGLSGDVKNI